MLISVAGAYVLYLKQHYTQAKNKEQLPFNMYSTLLILLKYFMSATVQYTWYFLHYVF